MSDGLRDAENNMAGIEKKFNEEFEAEIVLRECRCLLDALNIIDIELHSYNQILAIICLRVARLPRYKNLPFDKAVVEIVDKLTKGEKLNERN